MIHDFSDTLNKYVSRSEQTAGQIAQKIADLCQEESPLPRETLYRWLSPTTAPNKPRRWSQIIQLALALQLTEVETDKLLVAGQHKRVAELRTQTNHSAEVAGWLKRIQDTHAPTTPSRPAPFQVPRLPTGFVLRQQADMTNLRDEKLVVLQGMMGVGKSVQAVYLAYQWRELFPDGVLWLALDELDIEEALQQVAISFGYDFEQAQLFRSESRAAYLRNLLCHKQALLILDGVQSKTQIKSFLPAEGKSMILATSQQRGLAEVTCTIRPFDVADAYTFLAEKAGGELEDVGDLVGVLGGVPLALTAVGEMLSSTSSWTPATLTEAIINDRDSWPAALQKAVMQMYQSLPKEEAAVWVSLPIFEQASFTAEAVAYVLKKPLTKVRQILQALANQHLLLVPQAKRYQLPPLYHCFWGHAADTAVEGQVVRKHDYYLSLAQRYRHQYAQLSQEAAHLASAITYLQKTGQEKRLATAVTHLSSWWLNAGALDTAHTLLPQALQIAKKQRETQLQAELNHSLGKLKAYQGELDSAYAHYQEALRQARQLPEASTKHLLRSRFLTSCGNLAHRQAKPSLARDQYRRAQQQAELAGNREQIALITMNLAIVAQFEHNLAQAETLYQQALSSAEALPTSTLLQKILYNYGAFVHEQGNFAQAESCFRQGLIHARQQEDQLAQVRLLGNLGRALLAQGHTHLARQQFEEALQLAENLDNKQELSRLLASLADLFCKQNQLARAKTMYEQAVTLSQDGSFLADLPRLLRGLAKVYIKQDATSSAKKCLQEATKLAEAEQNQREMGRILLLQAQLTAVEMEEDPSSQNIEKLHQYAKKSIKLFEQLHDTTRANEIRAWLTEIQRGQLHH